MRLTDRVSFGNRALEYFVVCSIVVLMSVVSFFALQDILAHTRDAQRLGDMATLRTALELYHTDYGAYPYIGEWVNSAASSWIKLGEALRPYLTTMPRDPINDVRERVERTGAFNYSYVSIARNDTAAKKEGYLLVFRLEQPEDATLYPHISDKLHTSRTTFDFTELTGVSGIYSITAP